MYDWSHRKKNKIIKDGIALFEITTGSIVAINHDVIYSIDKHNSQINFYFQRNEIFGRHLTLILLFF